MRTRQFKTILPWVAFGILGMALPQAVRFPGENAQPVGRRRNRTRVNLNESKFRAKSARRRRNRIARASRTVNR